MVPYRSLVVGVIGGDGQMVPGEKLGREMARRGWILLTGGEVRERPFVEKRGEVKDAAMLGAACAEGEGSIARLVGIIPSSFVNWRRPSPHRLYLDTGLTHNVRNVLNGRTPDVVVAFGGSRGTLAEVAFARAAGHDVIFHSGIERLRRNLVKYFGPDAGGADYNTYFEEPVRTYPQAVGTAQTASGLVVLLGRTLADGHDFLGDPAALADVMAHMGCPAGRTGFPGLPADPGSCDRFERIIAEISM